MKNIKWHNTKITKQDRIKLLKQKPFVLWFTGLSGSGKSTIACGVEEQLFKEGYLTYMLDGDNIRHGLCNDLGFSFKDRKENIRRIGEVVKLFVDVGVIVLTAFISPYREDRQFIRSLLEKDEFIEIYIKCSLEVCKNRDPKKLYKKAQQGLIKNFTGIDDPYEEPINPEITVETDKHTIEYCIKQIIDYLQTRHYINITHKT